MMQFAAEFSLTARRCQWDDYINNFADNSVLLDLNYYTPLGYVLEHPTIFLDRATLRMRTLPQVVPYVGSKGNAVGAPEWRATPRLPPQL